MKFTPAITLLAACLLAGSAGAATVSEQVMQKGQFAKPNCVPDPKDPDYDECFCEADIRYPQVSDMEDTALQAQLNGWFKEQAAKTVCEGESAAAPAKAGRPASSHATLSVHYEVTLSAPQMLAFKFTDWAYTGGAHGNGSVIGVIVDLRTGKLLDPEHIFTHANMAAVNRVIYEALAAKPEEEIFRDQIEARKGAFIKDGECQGCTLTLTPDGVNVVFQTYEVAPYGAGNTQVPIPGKYVGNNAVKEALGAQKQTMPEKD